MRTFLASRPNTRYTGIEWGSWHKSMRNKKSNTKCIFYEFYCIVFVDAIRNNTERIRRQTFIMPAIFELQLYGIIIWAPRNNNGTHLIWSHEIEINKSKCDKIHAVFMILIRSIKAKYAHSININWVVFVFITKVTQPILFNSGFFICTPSAKWLQSNRFNDWFLCTRFRHNVNGLCLSTDKR